MWRAEPSKSIAANRRGLRSTDARAGQDPLFQVPRIDGTGTKHVAAMVRLDDDRVTALKAALMHGVDVAKIHQRRDPNALMFGDKAKIIGRVVRNAERRQSRYRRYEIPLSIRSQRYDPLEAVLAL